MSGSTAPVMEGTHPWSCSGHPIWKEIQIEAYAREDILEHGNDLQSEDILTTVIANLENSCLPDIFLFMHFDVHSFTSELCRDIGRDILLSDLERGHEWCL